VERNKAGLLKRGLSDPNKIFRLLKTLQPGEAVNLPDGTLLRAEEVMEAAKQGRKIVICGDTSDASGIAALAQDCDVLVHEATNAFLLPFDKGTYMDVERFARAHGHSTPQMAGHFAHRVRAKRLIMTHFSPRYKGDLSPESLAIMKRLEDMARKTSKLRADRVLAAHDLMLVPIPSPQKMAEVGADD
jgi:ribonuclease Z